MQLHIIIPADSRIYNLSAFEGLARVTNTGVPGGQSTRLDLSFNDTLLQLQLLPGQSFAFRDSGGLRIQNFGPSNIELLITDAQPVMAAAAGLKVADSHARG